MLVSTSHLERMCEDGFVFRFILNGHPSMKEERSHLNDRLGGFKTIDRLLTSCGALEP